MKINDFIKVKREKDNNLSYYFNSYEDPDSPMLYRGKF